MVIYIEWSRHSEGYMAVNTKYKLVKYDLSKGMRSEEGRAKDQGLIPRYLVNLSYNGSGMLSNRKAPTAYTGIYGARNDLEVFNADDVSENPSDTGGGLYTNYGATTVTRVTNLCSDGERIFGQFSKKISNTDESYISSSSQGLGSFVCELKSNSAGKLWHETSIPAPKAAVPLMSFDPAAFPSVGSGANSGEVVVVNRKRYKSDGTQSLVPGFNVVRAGALVNDPELFSASPSYTVYTGIRWTRVAGSGFSVSYDSSISAYRLFNHANQTVRSWVLKYSGAYTKVDANGIFDAHIIGSNLYLVTRDSVSNDIYMYRFATPVVSTGSPDWNTDVDLSAAAVDSIAYGAEIHTAIHISQGASSTLRFCHAHYTYAAAVYTNVIHLVDRNITTLASNFDYYNSSADKPGPILYATCNNNVVLAEVIDNDGQVAGGVNLSTYATDEFAGVIGDTIEHWFRKSCKVYGYTYGGSSPDLDETDLFVESGKSSVGPTSGTLSHERQTYLYSHLSTDGLVCVGDSIYQVYEEATEFAVTCKVRFICKVIDVPSDGTSYGTMSLVSGGSGMGDGEVSGSAARYKNSMSRWVDGRYVALPVGGGESSRAYRNSALTAPATNPGYVNQMTSNERLVLFDVQDVPLTAVKVSDGVTSFGHGWSLSTGGEATMSCSAVRPTIGEIALGSSTGASPIWTASDVFTYRAVVVCSVGGKESFISSLPREFSPSGDTTKCIYIPIYINAKGTTAKSIRLYRNNSPDMIASDYQFVGEVNISGGGTSFGIYDFGQDIGAKPFDPTGGGNAYSQGLFISGLRDIANVAGRSYVITSTAAYACQVGGGDDMLPTPMPDSEVQIPARHGKAKFINSLVDTAVVTTESSILGIGGNPPNLLGSGSQGAYVISEGVGATGKPVECPLGLIVADDDNIVAVDRSNNVVNISQAVSSFSFDGSMAYCANTGEMLVKTTDATYPWLVLDVDAGRWTAWTTTGSSVDSVATSNRGTMRGYIAFAGTEGYIDTVSGATYVAPEVHLGWDSFPDRFTVSNLGAIHVDGYSAYDNTPISCASSFDLSTGTFTETAASTTGGDVASVSRDSAGFRATLRPARVSGTSFKNVITFTTTAEMQLDTIAVEVQSDLSKYSSGT